MQSPTGQMIDLCGPDPDCRSYVWHLCFSGRILEMWYVYYALSTVINVLNDCVKEGSILYYSSFYHVVTEQATITLIKDYKKQSRSLNSIFPFLFARTPSSLPFFPVIYVHACAYEKEREWTFTHFLRVIVTIDSSGLKNNIISKLLQMI